VQIDLTGQVAFVTGSTRGIGRAVAETLYRAGAAVAVVGRDKGRAETVAAGLGDRAVGVACDVTDGAQVESAISTAEKTLGPIAILVNNAGITRDNLLLRMTEAEWDEVMQANLKGAFHTTKAVLKGMMKRRQGRIINVSSIIGMTGNKGQANYAASKAGLIAFTKSVAKEYGSRGILVNAIAPGFIETDMTGGLPEEARQAMLGGVILGRFGTPADVAGAVLFLASDLAGYITGQTLVVDGGLAV
jgi:3-oxoacyl-[acyl-carrier protein] reductase